MTHASLESLTCRSSHAHTRIWKSCILVYLLSLSIVIKGTWVYMGVYIQRSLTSWGQCDCWKSCLHSAVSSDENSTITKWQLINIWKEKGSYVSHKANPDPASRVLFPIIAQVAFPFPAICMIFPPSHFAIDISQALKGNTLHMPKAVQHAV